MSGNRQPSGTNDNQDGEAETPQRRRRRRYTPPTPKDYQKGRDFAAWLKAGLDKNTWNDTQLVQRTKEVDPKGEGISATWIGILRRDGVNPQTGDVAHPSEQYVEILAKALGMDLDAGLDAAGHKRRKPVEPGTIVLRTGDTYTLVANPTGLVLELELTPELLRELEVHAELQKLRRERGEVLKDVATPNNRK